MRGTRSGGEDKSRILHSGNGHVVILIDPVPADPNSASNLWAEQLYTGWPPAKVTIPWCFKPIESSGFRLASPTPGRKGFVFPIPHKGAAPPSVPGVPQPNRQTSVRESKPTVLLSSAFSSLLTERAVYALASAISMLARQALVRRLGRA